MSFNLGKKWCWIIYIKCSKKIIAMTALIFLGINPQMHYYQPMWTLVGGGMKKLEDSGRPMSQVSVFHYLRILSYILFILPTPTLMLALFGTYFIHRTCVVCELNVKKMLCIYNIFQAK